MRVIGRAAMWNRIGTKFLPFADVATIELPLSRLLRLSLFQISVGMSAALLTGTLTRVMIVELGISAGVVSAMISLPLLFAPFRAFIGHKSDTHRSILGWKRTPYIWFGTMAQFGGLAILPFALLVMSGQGAMPGGALVGEIGVAFAFLLLGAGMHTTQTAGLALATDLATEETSPRVVALLYVMLLVGMMVSALVIGRLLADYRPTRLAQVIQGVAVAVMLLNLSALWKQEARQPRGAADKQVVPNFASQWSHFTADAATRRLLTTVGLGAAAFAMQDVILEPYGGQILHLSVGTTTSMTALWAAGTLAAFGFAARQLSRGREPHRLAGYGCVVGLAAFATILFAAPTQAVALFAAGSALLGFGGGLFSVSTLTAIMQMSRKRSTSGLALGAWGAVGASSAGVAIALGGLCRDLVGSQAAAHRLGAALIGPETGYVFVFLCEIVLLLATLVALGPLVRRDPEFVQGQDLSASRQPFGLAEFPV